MVYSVQREAHLQSCVSVWQRDIQSSASLRTFYGMDEKNQTLYIHDSWRFETRLIEDSFRLTLSLFDYRSKLMLDNIIDIIVKACKMFRWCEQIDWRMQHRLLHHGCIFDSCRKKSLFHSDAVIYGSLHLSSLFWGQTHRAISVLPANYCQCVKKSCMLCWGASPLWGLFFDSMTKTRFQRLPQTVANYCRGLAAALLSRRRDISLMNPSSVLLWLLLVKWPKIFSQKMQLRQDKSMLNPESDL